VLPPCGALALYIARRPILEADSPAPPDGNQCHRCGGELRLLAYIPTRLGEPGYAIYECVACSVLEWIVDEERR